MVVNVFVCVWICARQGRIWAGVEGEGWGGGGRSSGPRAHLSEMVQDEYRHKRPVWGGGHINQPSPPLYIYAPPSLPPYTHATLPLFSRSLPPSLPPSLPACESDASHLRLLNQLVSHTKSGAT
jgi:hypothetical protein